jgi:hypothetical protein
MHNAYIYLLINNVAMKKIFIVLAVISLFGCNNNGEGKDAGSKDGKKKSKATIADSYTTDTLYQALPQMLQDISASENMEDLLTQNWTHADDIVELKNAQEGGLMIPVRSFSLSPDKSMIKNIRNALEAGTWAFDAAKKELTFTYKGGSRDVYKIRALAADELRLTNIGIGSETVLNFVGDGKRHKDISTDPYHISNNRWRFKPAAPENEAAVKQRLKDNLHFFILYYKDVIARRAEVVSFYGFPSCISWYAGAIYLQKDEDALEHWENCFNNKAQAQKATDIVAALLDKKYTWPNGKENWIKKNLAVLEQLYKNL